MKKTIAGLIAVGSMVVPSTTQAHSLTCRAHVPFFGTLLEHRGWTCYDSTNRFLELKTNHIQYRKVDTGPPCNHIRLQVVSIYLTDHNPPRWSKPNRSIKCF